MIYVVGATTMTTSHGSPDNVTFGGTYTGSLTETYTVTVANNTSLGATTNTKNMGSPDDIHFSGTYTGDTSTTYTITITGSGDTFQWSDGLGGTGDVWVTLGPVYLSHGISVVFGSWSYLNKEEWTADVTSTPAFNWTDGHGYSGSGVSPGTDISLSEGVTVSFPTSGYVSDDSWEMTIEYVPDVAPPGNLLYTDSSGKIKSIQTHDLIHASNGLTANAKYFIELGGTLTKATTIALDDNTLNIRNSSYDMGFLATDHLSVISGYPAGARNFVGSTAVGSTVLNGIIATPLEADSHSGLTFETGSYAQFILRSEILDKKSYIQSFEWGDGILMRSEDTDTPNIDSSDIVLNLGKLYLSAAGELHINSPAVIASSATNGQVLTLVDAATGLVEFQNAGAGSNWTLAGNAGTNPSTNFIGTTDSQDFVVKANSTELARFGTGSSVVIGPSNILGNTLNNFVLGASNTIDSSSYANYSVSIGSNNTNKAGRSITIGNRLTGNSAYEVALGSWNTTYTPGSVSSTTWIDTDRLFTVSNGYLTQSDAFTILKNGQTGVGIDNFEANTNGNIFQVGDGSTTVVGYVDSGTGNWVAVSDARTKENVQDINYGLEQVMALHPVQYDFIRNKEHAIGFIAQEVMPIIPDVVFGDEKQYGIAYQALVPVTVKAIQELNLKVTDIEKLETLARQNSFVQNLIAWFASASNGITRIFTDRLDTKQLCVEDVCVDRAQFLRMVEESSQVTGGQSPNPEPTPTPTTGDTTEGNSGDTVPTDTNSGNSDSPAPEQPVDPAPETPAL